MGASEPAPSLQQDGGGVARPTDRARTRGVPERLGDRPRTGHTGPTRTSTRGVPGRAQRPSPHGGDVARPTDRARTRGGPARLGDCPRTRAT
eukprot:3847840-Prymnesium_polylepis.1